MPSAKLLIGGAAAALAAVAARRARRAEPESVSMDEVADEVAAGEMLRLRAELRRELQRLMDADIKASRTRRESTSPPG
jgi:regulator of protease activity HflC (stomatin/prohibitin superfamily)